MLSDHASLLAWSMVNPIFIQYCSVSYFKGAHHGNGLRICCISQEDFHILYQGRDYEENGKQAEVGQHLTNLFFRLNLRVASSPVTLSQEPFA